MVSVRGSDRESNVSWPQGVAVHLGLALPLGSIAGERLGWPLPRRDLLCVGGHLTIVPVLSSGASRGWSVCVRWGGGPSVGPAFGAYAFGQGPVAFVGVARTPGMRNSALGNRQR